MERTPIIEPLAAVPCEAPPSVRVLEGVALDVMDGVAGYFRQHPQLEGLVARIAAALRSRFGDGTELVLTYYRDPEIDDRPLTLLVRRPQYQPGFIAEIDAVMEAFEDERDRFDGLLVVSSDYRLKRDGHGV